MRCRILPKSTKKEVSYYDIKNRASIKVSLDDLVLPSNPGLAKNLHTLRPEGLSLNWKLLMCFSKNLTISLLNDNYDTEIAL